MIKILIADDHTIIRQGIKQILLEFHDIREVEEASNGAEVMQKITHNEYDVILLDISMPGRDGIEILKEVKSIHPKAAILILSMHPEEQYALRAFRAGASGYLTKKSSSNEIINAIRMVAQGRKYISPTLAEKLAFELEEGRGQPSHESLSDREYQVMCMIASGKTVSEIAGELGLSVQTISTYRGRILSKMHMKNNAEITHYAIKKGLV
ncbi:MAG: response regulator transcription factor [Calditrichia bacterium]